MEATYKIIVSIKTKIGMVKIGSLLLGNDPALASATFDSLQGDVDERGIAILRLDLIMKESGRSSVLLRSLGCTLDQYTYNSKVIARDAFKFFTLEK